MNLNPIKINKQILISLESLLNNFIKNKDINKKTKIKHSLILKLKEHNQFKILDTFVIHEFSKENIFLLNIKDIQFLKDFINKEKEENNKLINRVEKALITDTHSSPVSINNILIKQLDKKITEVIECDTESFKTNLTIKTKAILIENAEVFNRVEELKCINKSLLQESDIIFSTGFLITNQKYVNFLSNYEEIYTFFDTDISGFKMYISLKKKLKNRIKNIYPSEFQKVKDLIIKPKKEKSNIYDFVEKNINFLTKEDIKFLQKWNENPIIIEQEIYLKKDLYE